MHDGPKVLQRSFSLAAGAVGLCDAERMQRSSFKRQPCGEQQASVSPRPDPADPRPSPLLLLYRQYRLQGRWSWEWDSSEDEEDDEDSEGLSCFPHTHIQSIFSFCTSLGASTKSRPLKRMTPPVTMLAEPQNSTYAKVSVHVSPEEWQFWEWAPPTFTWRRKEEVMRVILPAMSRQMMHIENATTIMMGSCRNRERVQHWFCSSNVLKETPLYKIIGDAPQTLRHWT